MPTLTYYTIEHQTDSSCYDIREKTKKAAIATLRDLKDTGDHTQYLIASYDSNAVTFEVTQSVLHYTCALDLLDTCLSESRGGCETKRYTYSADTL